MKIIKLKLSRLIISLLTIALVSTLLISCKSEFKKLPENKTNKSKIEFATKIATSYFMTLKNGNAYDFENNAIKDFTEKMTPNFQKQTLEFPIIIHLILHPTKSAMFLNYLLPASS